MRYRPRAALVDDEQTSREPVTAPDQHLREIVRLLRHIRFPEDAFRLWIPPVSSDLRGNSRAHWRTIHRLRKELKTFTALMVRSELAKRGEAAPEWTWAVVQSTWTWPNLRGMSDPDNLLTGLKSVFDGLQAGGLIGDDRNLVHLPPVQIVGGRSGVLLKAWGE